MLEIHSYNSGDTPIIRPYVLRWTKPGISSVGTLAPRPIDTISVVIEPKATNVVQHYFPADDDPTIMKLFLDSTDATGYSYRRTLNTNEYMNARQNNWHYSHRLSGKHREYIEAQPGHWIIKALRFEGPSVDSSEPRPAEII